YHAHDPWLGGTGAAGGEDEGSGFGYDDPVGSALVQSFVEELESAEGATRVEHDDVAVAQVRGALAGDVSVPECRNTHHHQRGAGQRLPDVRCHQSDLPESRDL